MKVSVVVPAFNEEKYIKRCLESLINQEEKADEIILINNNSIDNTVAIAKKFPQVTIVNEKIQGMIPARNRGFNEAKYDIIARTDADTIVPKNWIKKIKTQFTKHPAIVGLSGKAKFYELPASLPVETSWPPESFKRISKRAHSWMFGPNMSLKKSAWEKVKNEICNDDAEVHEDIDLAMHLEKYGKILYDPTLVVLSSPRRFGKLKTYIEYPLRYFKMIRTHKRLPKLPTRKKIVKAVTNRPKKLLKRSISLLPL